MPRRARHNRLFQFLFLALGVMLVALIVVLILLLTTGGDKEIDLETTVYVEGVSVAGVDVSGMTYQEAGASADLQKAAQDVADNFTYTFTVDGKEYNYSAQELGITSDLEQVLTQTLYYGNVGDGAEVRQQRTQARENGMDFTLAPYADQEAVLAKLQEYKSDFDVVGKDAELMIEDSVMGEGRFTYVDEVTGVDVDVTQLASMISQNVNNKDYSVIAAPAIITNPRIDVETLKENTKLISTYTSEFEGSTLGNPDRVANIRILADIVNGTVIKPGETWSINEAAGPRNSATAKTVGWKEAPGIARGRYEDQVGGGVCQVSSTVYNSAIRAEMDIVERTAHSWPSSYISEGMDATISTGGPDLKIANPYNMPVYMAAYINEDENKVTVEFYGPPLLHGYTVSFKTVQVGTIKAGSTIYHYNTTKLPDGTPIRKDDSVTWISGRDGQVWEVYKQYLDEDGNVIESTLFSKNTYDAYQGQIYVNGPDPDSIVPTPPPPEESGAPAE